MKSEINNLLYSQLNILKERVKSELSEKCIRVTELKQE